MTNSDRINKKFDKICQMISKTKDKCFTFWLDLNRWNAKNANKLRDFENDFAKNIVNELRVLQNEKITTLRDKLGRSSERKRKTRKKTVR